MSDKRLYHGQGKAGRPEPGIDRCFNWQNEKRPPPQVKRAGATLTQYEEEAFNDGYRCGREGKTVSDRIWQAPEHLEAWRQGFIAGEHDRMQSQPAKRPPGISNEPTAVDQSPPPFKLKIRRGGH